MTFRPATLDDLEEILAIIARADAQSGAWAPGGRPHAVAAQRDRERVSQRLAARDDHSEVAMVGGRLAGFVNVDPRDGVAHISYLFVEPHFQGRGIGATLLERAVADSRRRGFARATLHTAVLNARARRFYERARWAATGEVTFHEEIGLEMAHYALELTAP